jgi:surface polysaccharide O-acyltransferase-like enzyme
MAVVAGLLLYVFGMLAGSYANTPVGIPFSFDTMRGPFFSAFPVALGAMLARTGFKCSARVALTIATAGMILHFSEAALLLKFYQTPFIRHSYLIGTIPFAMGLVLFAFASPDFGRRFGLHCLGRYSLGLYALHVYILEAIRQGPFDGIHNKPFLVTLLVFVITSALVLTLGRVKLFQYFLR